MGKKEGNETFFAGSNMSIVDSTDHIQELRQLVSQSGFKKLLQRVKKWEKFELAARQEHRKE